MFVVVGHDSDPSVSAYPFNTAVGFGDKFANPTPVPAGGASSVAFSPLGDAVAIVHGASPYLSVYKFNNVTGFGPKYSDPDPPILASSSVAFSPDGKAIAVARYLSPCLEVYRFDSATGIGAKFSDPAILPPDFGRCVGFSPDGNAIVVSYESSPRISAYSFNSTSGFGAKFADPAVLPADSTVSNFAFSPAGDAIVLGHTLPPGIEAYLFSSSTGFGTRFASSDDIWSNGVPSIAFSPDGSTVLIYYGGEEINAIAWTSTGFDLANPPLNSVPSPAPAGGVSGMAFSPEGDFVAVAHGASPRISIYAWSVSGFGTVFPSPATLPTGPGRSVAITLASGSPNFWKNFRRCQEII